MRQMFSEIYVKTQCVLRHLILNQLPDVLCALKCLLYLRGWLTDHIRNVRMRIFAFSVPKSPVELLYCDNVKPLFMVLTNIDVFVKFMAKF